MTSILIAGTSGASPSMMQRVNRAMIFSPSTAPADNVTTRTRERAASQGENVGTVALVEEADDASLVKLQLEHVGQVETWRMEAELAEDKLS